MVTLHQILTIGSWARWDELTPSGIGRWGGKRRSSCLGSSRSRLSGGTQLQGGGGQENHTVSLGLPGNVTESINVITVSEFMMQQPQILSPDHDVHFHWRMVRLK